MNTTATTYVTRAIGLDIDAKPQPLELDSAVGVALRHNKKRAHLLVSNLLGKHTPQRPGIIDAGARILAVRAAAALTGADTTATDALLADLNTAIISGTNAPYVHPVGTHEAIVIGFAEAASALGGTVADHLGAYYLCSTRTPQREEYSRFLEAHSHASDHFLTPADPARLNDSARPVILVDDELTTGRTAMNTIRALHAIAAHPAYVIATLADLRTEDGHRELAAFADELGVPVRVASLVTASVTSPTDVFERAQTTIEAHAAPASTPEVREGAATTYATHPFAYVAAHQARDGVPCDGGIRRAAESIAASIDTAGERVLVLGVEEDMALGLNTALVLQRAGHQVDYSSTTRSPAAIIDQDGYALRDGVRIDGPWEEPRFIYNVTGRYDHIVIVTADPLYARATSGIAASLEGVAARVTVALPKHLAAPLVGPGFGSYAPDDVQWLLKDLSDVQLEVSLEDREELVQSGAHYAESLPQEYQPSEEYMTLFWDALDANAERVAGDIATVAHRIMRARRNRPVLVSLARAGTPVGVLLRRYMRGYLGYEAPHYAVSIVRGRGIDANALAYIAARHDPEDVIFVDGWTGKGAITAELRDALAVHEERTGQVFSSELAVLADTGDCTTIYGTRDDYLIPSAALNSTVSGLVSRTVLNDTLIGEDDYHGAKFYAELADADVSVRFIDEVARHFTTISPRNLPPVTEPAWASWAEVERLSEQYGIGQVNLVKPGVGETTRVLLRRVPWRVLLNPDAGEAVVHIRALAEARGVTIEEVPGLRFNAVGLIHPKFTKGATGADGKAAA
ncbi:phosphoribosyltransferase domain-containing protein [Microbacterium sp. 77mftsu3.1]|uniref:phosphoribosyltransferase domain-containing protein n=1 Tax=Microbacterium sp. 77mftsu3.1 TaxID=1761802 RepID=UPI000371324F|nr:phosphoribosyltransferase domain-containing protein [Microbacterium sp. 77mftsu3.1]SDH49129.1 TRSP domain C terminus to PRTase_2 [Microbacterium sp. 77mftsu3.1]